MSGAGKEDKPDKDYWKTGDPALRAKVISSVGVVIVVLSIIGSASFNSYNYYKALPQQSSQEQEDTDAQQSSQEQEDTDAQQSSQEQEDTDAQQSSQEQEDTDAQQSSQEQEDTDEKRDTGGQPPAPPADISTTVPVTLFLLFILGIILAIVGLISYLRRRKKAIH